MNSPEYTTSAPVIGPLIMCSGFVVSAKPYHARHRIASSSSRRRVASVDPSFHRARLVSRLVSSHHPHASSSRIIITHPHPHHHLSRQKSRSRRLSRRLSRRAHREHESPIRHRSPKMRRLRSRRSVDEGTNRHDPSSLASRSAITRCPSSFIHTPHTFVPHPRECVHECMMETRGTGRASNGREMMRWSESGDVAIGADRGCVVVEVRRANERARPSRMARMNA